MGRHGPLTSMALGRSPYDDVVYGEGEGDPRAPLQMYDERGRPVNPETKRVNRDIIRSHNEVMLVIGVVESENTIDELRAEHQRRQAHDEHDESIGNNLEWAARVCELGGVWGVGGMRQRILLYRSYSHVPFSSLVHVERQTQSSTSLCLHGLPAFVLANALDFPWLADNVMETTLTKTAFIYMQTSLKLWVFLQRTQLLPVSASPWFPSWKFFIPFSSSSAIPPCPLPTSLSFRSVVGWLGSVALSTTPFVAFYVVNGICQAVMDLLYMEIYDLLPNPSTSDRPREPGSGFLLQRSSDDRETEASQAQPAQDSAATPAGPAPNTNIWDLPQINDQPSNRTDPDRGQTPDQRSATPPGRPESAPSRPRSHPRRSHTPNTTTATEDFSSDDEVNEEIVNATLISFDVENHPESSTTGDLSSAAVANDASNNANAPPGVWSAELRPNPAGGGGFFGDSDSPWRDGDDTNGSGNNRRPPRPRMFRDNALTQLPASLAAGILARRASSLLLAPLEGASMRQVAWLWCRARGMPTAGVLWEPLWFWPFAWRRGAGRWFGWELATGAGFSLTSMVSLVGLELVHTLFDACLWCSVPLIVKRSLISEEEWDRRVKAEEAREQAAMHQQIDV